MVESKQNFPNGLAERGTSGFASHDGAKVMFLKSTRDPPDLSRLSAALRSLERDKEAHE
jgi:hypothetical protein